MARDYERENERLRERWKSDADFRRRRHDSMMRHNYGIGLDDYERMLAEQGGGCAICARTPDEEGRRLHVDHDHETGLVRGLLCGNCNRGIGYLGDSHERISSAADYLARASDTLVP